jgi:hypothetical protein
MKVTVKLVGVPELPPTYEGQKEVAVDFPGNSVGDLIHHFLSRMDSKTKGIFLDEKREITPDLFIIVNGFAVSGSNRFNLPLKEGDLIELVSSAG